MCKCFKGKSEAEFNTKKVIGTTVAILGIAVIAAFAGFCIWFWNGDDLYFMEEHDDFEDDEDF